MCGAKRKHKNGFSVPAMPTEMSHRDAYCWAVDTYMSSMYLRRQAASGGGRCFRPLHDVRGTHQLWGERLGTSPRGPHSCHCSRDGVIPFAVIHSMSSTLPATDAFTWRAGKTADTTQGERWRGEAVAPCRAR